MGDKEDDTVFTLSMADDTDALRCRFYENVFPEPEEVIMVNVTEIGEMVSA
jgi:hypothetical protein